MRKMVELMSNPIFGPAFVLESEAWSQAKLKAAPYVKENYQQHRSQKKEENQKVLLQKGQPGPKELEEGNDKEMAGSQPAAKMAKEAEKEKPPKHQTKKGTAIKDKKNNLANKGGYKN